MSLQLQRPLAVIDLETTGVDIDRDRIVQIAVVRSDGLSREWLINPGQAIPELASAIHGITQDMVAGAPTFRAVADDIYQCIVGCDIGTYNGRAFDVPMLSAEFRRAHIRWPLGDEAQVDARRVFDAQEPHTLEAAVRRYVGRTHAGAHDACHDARATLDVILRQAEVYNATTLAELADRERAPDWIDSRGVYRWKGRIAVITIGKDWAGKPLAQVDRGFLQWMLGKDFPPDTKQITRDALNGRYPQKESAA